jgi:hypothetical protein
MVTIRCTQKLLRRVHRATAAPASTTLLGDWYANILFARPEQLILCISERSLLPVVVTAREASALGGRLASSLGDVLFHLGVPSHCIEREQAEMTQVAFTSTQNRRVLGTLNELMFQLSWYLHGEPSLSLLEASLKLARTPCSAIGHASPMQFTPSLFGSSSVQSAMVQ